MATHQSFLEEYEHQLNQEIEENMAILSHLSQWEHAGEQMPHREIQQALKREKQNACKLVPLKIFNEELLSVAEEQHQQLGSVCTVHQHCLRKWSQGAWCGKT